MAQSVNKLSAPFVSKVTKPGRYNDGLGLYAQVSQVGDNITKAWLLRFKLNGRKREMGLGSVNVFSLAEVRERARACRQLLDRGIDPIEHRKAAKLAEAAEAAKAMTFEQAAEAFIADKRSGWRAGRNGGHAAEFASTLRNYAFATLGSLPVAAIETAHVVTALRPIWTDKHETAVRVRGRIEMVLNWATAGGFRSGENPARWKGHLENILTKPKPRALRVKHHAAVPYTAMPDFMAKVTATESLLARAIEMLALTATRLGELRAAQWSEIDLDAALWTIPPERTKTHREHRVPLSRRVVALLKALPRDSNSPFVFPGLTSPRKPLDPVALRSMLHTINGGNSITLHGFRSSFRDWVGDCTTYPREVAEAALAHTVGDKAERAYRRGDALDKRRAMMADWAKFCGRKP
jgi:integrase